MTQKTDSTDLSPKGLSKSLVGAAVLAGLLACAFVAGYSVAVLVDEDEDDSDHRRKKKGKGDRSAVVVASPPRQDHAAKPTVSQSLLGQQVTFSGSCDASGAVPLDRHTFAVADDEDNVIRIYDTRAGGPPLREINLEPTIPPRPEADIEAATRFENEAFWLGSHGRSRKGRMSSERLVLFGTKVPSLGGELEMVGEPYDGLLEALARDQAYDFLDLIEASQRRATSPGGLNFEGMTSTDRGTLLLGFRNPVPDDKAVVAELLNPSEVLWGDAPVFAPPILLGLGGRGVRALTSWRGDYFLVAGPQGHGTSKVYRWRGRGAEPSPVDLDLDGLNPEAFFTPEDRDEILLISDDGTRLVDGEPCKRLKDSSRKNFRAIWVELSSSGTGRSARSAPGDHD